MKTFEYLEAKTLKDASRLLARYEGKAKVLAGGTDLLVSMKRRDITPQYVINIKTIPNLDYIHYADGEGLKIGTLATLRSIESSSVIRQRFPVLASATSKMASIGIRNMGTIGGNLCNASPGADTAPPLMGLGATVRIEGPKGERQGAVEEFFLGQGKNSLQNDEILTEIQIPDSLPYTQSVYLKLSRTAADLAIVGVAALVTLDLRHSNVADARIVLGAVGPIPLRARQAEGLVKGKAIKEVLTGKVAETAAAEAQPISDLRASAEYRRDMVRIMTKQAISKVLADA
jgi:carbon-monoxide dehydrogenase medium subunit